MPVSAAISEAKGSQRANSQREQESAERRSFAQCIDAMAGNGRNKDSLAAIWVANEKRGP